MDDQAIAEQNLLDKLDLEEAAEKAAPAETPIQEASPETVTGETTEQPDEGTKADPAEPVIAPPESWKAEAKERFKTLPRDLQQVIADREVEQKSAFNRQVNESTVAKQAAEQERQRYATQLDSLIQQATALDPVLSIASRMGAADWTRLWTENPGQAGALEAQIRERQNVISNWANQRQALAQQQVQTMETQEAAKLAEKLPEWKDESKRAQFTQTLRKVAQDHYGFRPEELSNVLDHRHVLALADAVKWQQHLAAQKTAQEKKVAQPQRVMKPSSTNQPAVSDRVKALKQRAIRTGKDDDVMAALMAAQS